MNYVENMKYKQWMATQDQQWDDDATKPDKNALAEIGVVMVDVAEQLSQSLIDFTTMSRQRADLLDNVNSATFTDETMKSVRRLDNALCELRSFTVGLLVSVASITPVASLDDATIRFGNKIFDVAEQTMYDLSDILQDDFAFNLWLYLPQMA